MENKRVKLYLGPMSALSALTTDQHDLAKMLLIPHKLNLPHDGQSSSQIQLVLRDME